METWKLKRFKNGNASMADKETPITPQEVNEAQLRDARQCMHGVLLIRDCPDCEQIEYWVVRSDHFLND